MKQEEQYDEGEKVIKGSTETEGGDYPEEDYEIEYHGWLISFRSRAGYEEYSDGQDFGSMKVFGSKDGAISFNYFPKSLIDQLEGPRTAEEFLTWKGYESLENRQAWDVEAGEATGYKYSYFYPFSNLGIKYVNYTIGYELFCENGDRIRINTFLCDKVPPDIENVMVRKKNR